MKQKRQSAKVRRDSMDFRDLIYQPALVRISAEKHPDWRWVTVLDQRQEGACTGFGLAAVINYLNRERGDAVCVSPRMLFEMAKRFDQWPGENYDYSSARGAMKGWHKSGVCSEALWKYQPNKRGTLTEPAKRNALQYPLGAYYRILPNVADLHAALNEVSVVFASAATHDGWDNVDKKGVIRYSASAQPDSGHAFAIVGYTKDGFIIQNSWGKGWGGYSIKGKKHGGTALWLYDDFEQNVWDLWVARLALPQAYRFRGTSRYTAAASGIRLAEAGPASHDIDGHYVHIDDGQFDSMGDYPSSSEQVDAIMNEIRMKSPKHILLYAHGGLNSVKDSAKRVGTWRECFDRNGIYEIHFIWETGFLAELKDILIGKDKFARERAGGDSSWWDNMIESASQPAGYALWKEMKADADRAFQVNAAGTEFLGRLKTVLAKMENPPRLHLAGHSAGSIWHARLIEQWKALGLPKLGSLSLFAPACTHGLFTQSYEPVLGDIIPNIDLYILSDEDECNDSVGGVYRKSLLYLVSRAYESKKDTVPLLGMENYLSDLSKNARRRMNVFITDKNTDKTSSASHGGFDNDLLTMNSLLETVTGAKPVSGKKFTAEELKGY
jgi:hypothetical protein